MSDFKNFECDDCGKKFRGRTGLNIHRGQMHSAKCCWMPQGGAMPCGQKATVTFNVDYVEQEGPPDTEPYCDKHAVSAAIEIMDDSVLKLVGAKRNGESIPQPRVQSDILGGMDE